MLDNRRLATGQVAERPIADPGVLQMEAGRFRAAEPAAGDLKMALVVAGGRRDRAGVPYTPAPFTEPGALPSVRLVRHETDRQFERLSNASWQVQERQEAVSLAVIVPLSLTFHQRSPPVRHRRVGRPRVGPSRCPRVYEHRRRRIAPADPTVRKSCFRSAHRLADAEVQVVPRHSQTPRGPPEPSQARIDI